MLGIFTLQAIAFSLYVACVLLSLHSSGAFPLQSKHVPVQIIWEVFRLFYLMQIVSTQKEENLLEKGHAVIKWLLSIGCISWNYTGTTCTAEPTRSSGWRGRQQLFFTTKHLTFAVKLLQCSPTLGSSSYCKNNYLCCFQFCHQVVGMSYVRWGIEWMKHMQHNQNWALILNT